MTNIVKLKTKKPDENQAFQEIDHNKDLTNQQREALSHRFRLLCCNQKMSIEGINDIEINTAQVMPCFVYCCNSCNKIELRACMGKIKLFNDENTFMIAKTYSTQIIKFIPKSIPTEPEAEEKPKPKKSLLSRFFTKRN